MVINESNNSAVVFLALVCRRRNVTGEMEAVPPSAASLWPHFCLFQLRRPARDVVADSPSSAIRSSSFAGVVHSVATTRVYWPKGPLLIPFRRERLFSKPRRLRLIAMELALGSGNSSVSALIITEISSGFFAMHCESCTPSTDAERSASRLVTGQSAIRAPYHSQVARHCHRSRTCHLQISSVLEQWLLVPPIAKSHASPSPESPPTILSPGGLPRCVKFPALLFLLVSANRTCLCSVAPDVPRVQFHFDGSAWQPIDRLYALRYNRQCRRRQSAPAPEHRLLLRVFHPPSMAGFMGIPLLVS